MQQGSRHLAKWKLDYEYRKNILSYVVIFLIEVQYIISLYNKAKIIF